MIPNQSNNKLLAGILEVEGIDQHLDELAERIADIKATMKEWKSKRKTQLALIRAETSFPPKVVEQLIQDRKTPEEERVGFETLVQVGRAMLGMLNGTPLGDSARKAFDQTRKRQEEAARKREPEDDGQDPLFPEPDPPLPDEPPSPPQPALDDPETARERGREAARTGGKITSNPYPADEPKQRAAFDEGWCEETGTDGMEIPDMYRRTEPTKKPGKGGPGGEQEGEGA